MPKPIRKQVIVGAEPTLWNQHHAPMQIDDALYAVLVNADAGAITIYRDSNANKLGLSVLDEYAGLQWPASICSFYAGGLIQILAQLENGEVHYLGYNPITSTWKASQVAGGPRAHFVGCTLVWTPEGLHAAFQVSNAGYSGIATSSSPTGDLWTPPTIAVPGGGHYQWPQLVAVGNRVHLAVVRRSDAHILLLTRESAAAPWGSPLDTDFLAEIGTALGRGVAYVRGGMTRVAYPYLGYPVNQGGWTMEFASGESPTDLIRDQVTLNMDSVPALTADGQSLLLAATFGKSTYLYEKPTMADGWNLAKLLASEPWTELSIAPTAVGNKSYLSALRNGYNGTAIWSDA